MTDLERSDLVRLVTVFMRAHLDEPVTIDILCDGARCSKASLSAAFSSILQTSPMAYLKSLRLADIRHKLQDVDNSCVSVIELAAFCGFWHAGHFRRAYRTAYGETPSETRRAARATSQACNDAEMRPRVVKEGTIATLPRAWHYASAEY